MEKYIVEKTFIGKVVYEYHGYEKSIYRAIIVEGKYGNTHAGQIIQLAMRDYNIMEFNNVTEFEVWRRLH